MSYVEQSKRRNPVAVAAVMGAHVAIGYALLSGLAYQVIKVRPTITDVVFPTDQPPPPARHDIPKTKVRTPTEKQVLAPDHLPDEIKQPPIVNPFPPTQPDTGSGDGGGMADSLPQPPRQNLARDAIPTADRMLWITTEDYPAAALRQNLQGIVVISATIGTDGRVRSCVVTQSSGSQLLDDTTCRLYSKRAHFMPARDAYGNPTSAQRIDRFRWQIPNE